MTSVYLIGSLRNPKIPQVANILREAGHDVFDDWFSPGPNCDDEWKTYEQLRGRSYLEASKGTTQNTSSTLICTISVGSRLVSLWLLPDGRRIWNWVT